MIEFFVPPIAVIVPIFISALAITFIVGYVAHQLAEYYLSNQTLEEGIQSSNLVSSHQDIESNLPKAIISQSISLQLPSEIVQEPSVFGSPINFSNKQNSNEPLFEDKSETISANMQ